jgi:hypothetical protein
VAAFIIFDVYPTIIFGADFYFKTKRFSYFWVDISLLVL